METATFISVEDCKLYVDHPGKVNYYQETVEDEKGQKKVVERKDTIWEPKLFKCHFTNCVFTTNDPQCADGIRNHRDFGRRFFDKPASVGKVENKYLPEKQTLADALSGMSLNILRGIAKERDVAKWERITSLKKEQLVDLMVEHKDKLGSYATIGN